MSIKRNALGKGLSALLENIETDITSKGETDSGSGVVGTVSNILLKHIQANPFQPRNDFDDEALRELSVSIKEQGIIQPITVRKLGYDEYQIISGERRVRASKIAGLDSIPAYIRVANDQSMLEMALVENIQREDLNAIDIGISYKRLIEECNVTQEEVSDRVGKNRTTVTNYIRLLKLPPEIQAALRDKKISMGHARAILGFGDIGKQLSVFREIMEKDLNVRDVEELLRSKTSTLATQTKTGKSADAISLEISKIQSVLSNHFDSRVQLSRRANGKGKIVIPFADDADLNRILELLNF